MGFGRIIHTISCDRPGCKETVDMQLSYDHITHEVKGKVNNVPINWAKTELFGGIEKVLCSFCLENLRLWYKEYASDTTLSTCKVDKGK